MLAKLLQQLSSTTKNTSKCLYAYKTSQGKYTIELIEHYILLPTTLCLSLCIV